MMDNHTQPKPLKTVSTEFLPGVHKPRVQTLFKHEDSPVYFERELSFFSSVNFILNYVIGVGIFSSPGQILEECGSVGMSVVMWCFCGVISLMTVLPFAELCSVVPKSGSQYIYIHEAFKDFHPFFGHTPSFIYVWINFLFLRPVSYAIHSIISAEYVWAIIAPAVSEDFEINFGFLIKSLIGACLLEQAVEFDMGFETTTLTLEKMPFVLYTGLYAYDGAIILTGALEEIKNPDRTVLRSLIMGLGLVTACYLLLNFTFLSALTPAELISSKAVAQEFTDKLFGSRVAFLVSICVSLCTAGGNLSGIFYSARLGYAAAKEGHMLQILSYIHKTRLTPTPAVIFQVILSLVFFLFGNRTQYLVNAYSFVLWLYYGLTMIALMILRVKKPEANRPYKVPLAIPWLVLVISWMLVFASIITRPSNTYFPAVVGISIGIIVQYVFVFKKNRIRGLGNLMKILQKWMDVVPPTRR
ncbi:b(0,+)-type amino acid transporter 1-like [Macrosteles quadrilineatus]|uniref:b(0,+)-type amino acid transporter 1-like n=1 Tax=Macrosteles quadrilineatus TaxID=74068 RepID=UPI0023E0F14B|nr:b(0,+)-type amino acid transporter 1-like [Macrosteles quadrilineatus]